MRGRILDTSCCTYQGTPLTQAPSTEAPAPHRGGVQWRNLSWIVIGGIGLMHAVAVLAFWPQLFSWSGLGICLGLIYLTSGVGVTLGFHRLLTHRSFKTPRWFEYVVTVCGCLAWQGGPANWVGMHRLHHRHSDDDLDPHSPKHGFTWAHILWTLHRDYEGLPLKTAAMDLLRRPGMRWLNKLFWVPQLLLTALLFGLGWWIGGVWLGLSWVVWGVAVRTVYVFHTTWFVNSASHTWGYQNYGDTGEHSTNLWWVALLTFGEGWHNNHHAHPRSAAHGLRWFEIDPTYWLIRVLGWVGLARKIQHIDPEQMPKAAKADALDSTTQPPTVLRPRTQT